MFNLNTKMIDKLETLGNESIAVAESTIALVLGVWGGLFDLILGSTISNPVGALSPTIFEENRQVKSTRPHPTISRRLTIANNLTVIGNFSAQGN